MKKGVYLVGAGPGDPELITVRGAKLIESADVIVYDHLANPSLLNYSREGCKHIYVGKEAGQHNMAQEAINALLVELSKSNEVVVRLKGGDPYVFGRGGEEGTVLYEAGVNFEVVPGITSAIGGLTYAGIPVTSRHIATSFHVITGHVSKNSEAIQFEPLAQLDGTLVFLMGVSNLPNIVENLLKYGKKTSTPVAIIYRASTPDQKVIVGTLENIVGEAEASNIKPPSLIVIGDVVHHREQLAFFEKRVLFGKHIAITRSREGQSKMTARLTELGAKVTQLPTIRIQSQNLDLLRQEIKEVDAYQGLIFTSGVAVKLFFEALNSLSLDVRHLYKQKIYCVGRETQKVLIAKGIITSLLPRTYTKDGLADLIRETSQRGERFLLPRSAKGDPLWLSELNKDFILNEIQCYDTISHRDPRLDITQMSTVDYLTFTSASTVHGYMDQAKEDVSGLLLEVLESAKLCVIGPATRLAAESYHLKVDLQPKDYTINDMIATIVEDSQTTKE